ncbi:MAG: hypothetical protein H0Z24_03275 [Thermosipho sp. (in: Bacteria)]|nr:hypothetical protein [Thermosipho sp. (in: thermotogales)]
MKVIPKMRVYNYKTKKMEQVAMISYDIDGIETLSTMHDDGTLSSFFAVLPDDIGPNKVLSYPMMFIGLKDKNGQLIFEGDILRPIVAKKDLYVVCWNQSSASFYLRPVGQKEGGYSLYVNEYGYAPYEVVGNVYENPELLGDEASAG